ncbi:hypothetical protein M5689_022808 [Euphorbia peplus]|nr:hypothetical protein M5689_022808 [Euphorbia peplus]
MSLPTTTAVSSATTTTKPPSCATSKTYSGKDKACECFTSIYIITLLAIIICATPFITKLLILLQPKTSDFSVVSSTFSVLNVSSSAIMADWNLTLSSTNPNKNTIFYDTISAVALINNSLSLSTAVIPPFRHIASSRRILEVKFSGMVVEKLNCTEYSCGVLSVALRAGASYGGWTWPVKTDKINVVCGGFEVGFPENVTSLKFGYKECSVNGKWKKIVESCRKIFWKYIFVAVIVVGVLALSL